jgi:hypothetical protein
VNKVKSLYWHSGALICPTKHGYEVMLSKERKVIRDTERKAKWAATAFKTLNGVTFKEQLNATSN